MLFNGMEFYSRLNDLCQTAGITVSAFLMSIGKQRSLGTSIKIATKPNREVAEEAAKRFNVPIEWLIGSPTESTTKSSAVSLTPIYLNERETDLILCLRESEPQTVENVYKMAYALLSPKDSTRRIFFDSHDDSIHHSRADFIEKRSKGKAAAGIPIEAVPEDEDAAIVRVPLKYTGSNYFVVEAQGDSMIGADIHSGDFCVFQADAHHDNGRIVLAQITDSSTDQYTETIKRLYVLPDKVELRSENPAYPPLFYPRDEVQIAGVLVYISSANNAR